MNFADKAQRAIDRYTVLHGTPPTFLVISQGALLFADPMILSLADDGSQISWCGTRVLLADWLPGEQYLAGELEAAP